MYASTDDQFLAFEVNGAEADLEKLADNDYTVKFLASKDVFEDDETGELKSDLIAGKFDYQVVVSKEGQDDIVSEYATVTVVDGEGIVSIDTIELTVGDILVTSGKLTMDDENIKLEATEGTNVKGGDEQAISDATYTSKNKTVALISKDDGEITLVLPGTVTFEIKVGNVTKEVTYTVVDEERALTTVTANKASVDMTTATEKVEVVLTLADQFGDPIRATLPTIATVQNADKKAITEEITGISAADIDAETGKTTTTIEVKPDENTGSGNLVIKDSAAEDAVTLLTIPVTVGDGANVDHWKLETETEDNIIDLNTEADPKKMKSC